MSKQRSSVLRRVSCVITVLVIAVPALAWSNKEHVQLTRIAAMRLVEDPGTPDGMKRWLREVTPDLGDWESEKQYFLYKRIGVLPRGVDGLTFWATAPDMFAMTDGGRMVEPYGVPERALHFIDVELFNPDESKRSYAHDLSHKPALADIPRDPSDERFKRAGMLPFRVQECYGKLVDSIRKGRLNDEPGRYPRDNHAAKWAGYLAHYAQDNTQPHHATLDYKSESYLAGPNKPNVHSELEYKMADDEYDDNMPLREAFWPLFVSALQRVKDPILTDDLWQATVEVSLASYDGLPLIGLAAMHATGQAGTPGHLQGTAGRIDTDTFFRFKGPCFGKELSVMDLKAHQLALAVARTQRLWLQAWKEATSAER